MGSLFPVVHDAKWSLVFRYVNNSYLRQTALGPVLITSIKCYALHLPSVRDTCFTDIGSVVVQWKSASQLCSGQYIALYCTILCCNQQYHMRSYTQIK